MGQAVSDQNMATEGSAGGSYHLHEVIIIGAGMAGISTAEHLYTQGVKNILVLEATDRIGGRIHTVNFGNKNTDIVELGANWIHGSALNNPVMTLANRQKHYADKEKFVKLNRIAGHCYTPDGRAIDKDLLEKLYELFLNLEVESESFYHHPDRKPTNCNTLEDYIKQKFAKFLTTIDRVRHSDAKAVFNCLWNYEQFHAGFLHDIPLNRVGLWSSIPGGNVILPGGYQTIVHQLANNLPSGCTLLNHEVSNVAWDSPIDVTVKCTNGKSFHAKHVIITVSLGFLKNNHKTLFMPSLSHEKLEAIAKIGFHKVGKIFLYFNEPFWKLGEGGIKLAWTELQETIAKYTNEWYKTIFAFDEVHNNRNVLVAWFSGNDVEFCEKLSDKEVLDTCTQLLREFLGDPSIPEPSHIIRSKWCTNPYTLGTYSYISMKTDYQQQINLERPMAVDGIPRVCFAGEATGYQFSSTTNGARASGIREAERLLNVFGKAKVKCKL